MNTKNAEILDISTHLSSGDFDLLKDIVNQGIDSRLEGFTKSRFYYHNSRFHFDFAPAEIQILLRRLLETGTDHADLWAYDIVDIYYGYETI